MSQQEHQQSNHSPGADDGEPAEDGIPPKPKRPLTVYNLFGKLERNYIVQSSQKRAHVSSESGSTEGTTSESSIDAVDPYLELRPAKYRDIMLPHDWFKVGRNKTDRKFYQAHHVIAFQDLSKVVTERWSKVDDETRTFLQTIYDRELAKYRIEMKEYAEMYGEDALESQKMVYKSRKANEDAARDSKGADSSKKPKATYLSPKDQLMRALQHDSRTSTVSDISNHTAQGSTTGASSTSSSYSQWNQLFNSHVASWQMINPLTSTTSDTLGPLSQGNSASASDYSHWNQLLNSHAASWQANPYNLSLHGNVLSSTDPHFNQLQNSMNNDPNRNQPASATFQMGNNPDSSSGNSIGSNNMVIPFGSVEAAGISGTATRSTSDQTMSNLPSSGLANPYVYAQMPSNNHGSFDNQILVPIIQMPTQQSQSQSHASFFAQPNCRTAGDHSIINQPLTLPTYQFENPTATAYSMQHIQNQASFQLEQSSFGNPVHSLTNELCEGRQVPTKPDACTKLESVDHTNDSSSSESNVSFELLGDNASNVMLGEDLKNTFDSDSS